MGSTGKIGAALAAAHASKCRTSGCAASIASGRPPFQLGSHGGQRAGIFTLDEIDQALAHLAAQLEIGPRPAGADEDAQLHGSLAGVGDLHHADAAIPIGGLFAQAAGLASNGFHRHGVVGPQEHRAQDVGTAARPVLEGMIDEPAQRARSVAARPTASAPRRWRGSPRRGPIRLRRSARRRCAAAAPARSPGRPAGCRRPSALRCPPPAPATPAEASRLAPNWRARGNVISTKARPVDQTRCRWRCAPARASASARGAPPGCRPHWPDAAR